jgi:hypothetical protein
MVEKIEMKYHPTILRVETTATGTQDTAILPTCLGHIPDHSTAVLTFFNPALNLVTLQRQYSNIMARKGGRLCDGQKACGV